MSDNTSLVSIKKYLEIWVMVALTIFLLGYYFFPSSSKQNTFFYLGVCIPIVLLLPAYFKQLRPNTWLTATALAFAFYLFLNSLWSIHFSSVQSLKYLRYLFTLYCLFAAVFLLQHKKPNSSELLFKAFIIIGFFQSVYGIFDHFANIAEPLVERYHDPIDSAMLAGLLFLTCFWLIAENKSWKKSFIYLGLSIPFVFILILSKSRGPQLSLILTLPLVAYFQSQNIKRFIPMLPILLVAIASFLTVMDTYSMTFSRGSAGWLSVFYHTEIWLASLSESLDFFWFGQGASHKPPLYISTGQKFNHSHNILLTTFRMGGITGVLLFSSNLILCFFAGLKHANSANKIWVIWLFFGVLCLMANGKYLLHRPSSIWMAYWIPVAFICASYTNFLSIKYNEKNS